MLAPLWPLLPLVSFFKPCALHFCVLVLLVCMLEIKFNSKLNSIHSTMLQLHVASLVSLRLLEMSYCFYCCWSHSCCCCCCCCCCSKSCFAAVSGGFSDFALLLLPILRMQLEHRSWSRMLKLLRDRVHVAYFCSLMRFQRSDDDIKHAFSYSFHESWLPAERTNYELNEHVLCSISHVAITIALLAQWRKHCYVG